MQSAEALPDKTLTQVLCPFCTEFSTKMLKTSEREVRETIRAANNKKAARARAAFLCKTKRLSRNFFQQFLIDVEVRVDVLHIVMLFEGLHEANHRVGLLTFQLDVSIGNHAHAR